jgi:hypothetical protein
MGAGSHAYLSEICTFSQAVDWPSGCLEMFGAEFAHFHRSQSTQMVKQTDFCRPIR